MVIIWIMDLDQISEVRINMIRIPMVVMVDLNKWKIQDMAWQDPNISEELIILVLMKKKIGIMPVLKVNRTILRNAKKDPSTLLIMEQDIKGNG